MLTTTDAPTGVASRLRATLFGDEDLPHPALMAAGSAAIVVGVVLRFWAPTALWLDEALSVNISKLPLTQIPGALAHDGSPPLYYVMLHYWMAIFGEGDFAVRALSGLISVATLPVFWLAGRRVGGRRVAWVTFYLALSSPFAIEYATSARMYSLMILLSLLGYLAVSWALERPTGTRLAAVTGVTAALLYTHYWGVYLILVTGLWLAWRVKTRAQGWPVLRAMIVGVALWLPWSPVFAFQALHTGTPWTSAASPGDLLGVLGDWSGSGPWGALLMLATFALFLLGTFGRSAAPGTLVTIEDPAGFTRRVPAGPAVVVELRPRPGMGPLAGIALATLATAVVLGAVANAAFVARYTAVVVPLFLLVVSTGVAVLPGARFRAACVAVLALAGLLTGYGENSQQRTQATQVAAVLNAQAQPGDVVVYCPDQLGPAVSRLVSVAGLDQITFPRGIGPERVDWVDYRQVVAATNVELFAQEALAHVTAGHTLWLVWRDGYGGLGGDCGYLESWLGMLDVPGATVVRQDGSTFYEYENLVRYTG